MILATYQPMAPDPFFNKNAVVARKAIREYLGFTPIWCFSANNLKEFYIHSVIAAPNYPEVLYIFETDDYIPIDIVQWNTYGYYSYTDTPFDLSCCFYPCDPKYQEYIVKEIPEDKLIFKINLHDAIYNTKYHLNLHFPSELYHSQSLDDLLNYDIRRHAAEFIDKSIKHSTIVGADNLSEARKMLKLRVEKEAFEGFFAGFIIGSKLPGSRLEDLIAFKFKTFYQKRTEISRLLITNYNWDSLPTYERQDKIIELISSCYQKLAPWGNAKIGRNDLCPCGSGKKYKKCCINKYV